MVGTGAPAEYNAVVSSATHVTVFVLSPARCGGERAAMLAASRHSELGRQLHDRTAPLGDVFAWLSALYFRGKLTYARRFAGPTGTLVMAPGRGLASPDAPISGDELRAMGQVDIESDAFVSPLRRDAAQLAERCGRGAQVVLLGSIATGKYVDPLLEVFAERLVFPESFVGRGDMSRGGLLLRAARSGQELAYRPISGAIRHGKRPPRLPRTRA
ncbi:MAG TPA: hypothetical protein VHW23_01085 [Kofleriaceae bacterium]|nr:hypothetical protein [Kofleriaceae bacterium]